MSRSLIYSLHLRVFTDGNFGQANVSVSRGLELTLKSYLLVLHRKSCDHRPHKELGHRGTQVWDLCKRTCPFCWDCHDSNDLVRRPGSRGDHQLNHKRPQEMVDMFKPEFVAPIVGYLTSQGKPSHFVPLSCFAQLPQRTKALLGVFLKSLVDGRLRLAGSDLEDMDSLTTKS